jgi:hypothetical protein
MKDVTEMVLDQEVRIRLLERIAENIDNRFDKLESEIKSNFHWTLGMTVSLFIGTTCIVFPLFGAAILHMAKLI